MGRLKDGWHLQNEGDGTTNLVRKHRHIPVHFKRNSLCATGVIRMLTENTDVFILNFFIFWLGAVCRTCESPYVGQSFDRHGTRLDLIE